MVSMQSFAKAILPTTFSDHSDRSPPSTLPFGAVGKGACVIQCQLFLLRFQKGSGFVPLATQEITIDKIVYR